MMRSLVLSNTILCLWAALSRASAESVVRNTKETTLVFTDPWSMVVKDDNERTLQTTAALYRVTWGTQHTGSCVLASVPGVTMNCTGGAAIALSQESDQANCAVTSASEMFCKGNLGQMFYNAEFTCTGADLGASAILGEETEDCLGGTPEVGSWVHGVQIFLLCGDEPQGIGKCDPIESLGANNACSLGYSCENGDCRDVDLTIPDISSIFDAADVDCLALAAGDTSAPTATDTESDAPTNTSAPTSSPAPIMDESMGPSMMPSMEDDAIDSTKPPTSEQATSGSTMNKLTAASILVAATTMFDFAGYF